MNGFHYYSGSGVDNSVCSQCTACLLHGWWHCPVLVTSCRLIPLSRSFPLPSSKILGLLYSYPTSPTISPVVHRHEGSRDWANRPSGEVYRSDNFN